ncbi:cytochrome c family protein [Novosphingobium sp. EMRT-2]|uniref:c-type cytochrome n=1 Tax=Novosphingobium sp. EMRT-2 TaxID=2571749 RepID=UPI0010BD191C|nr:c-type cytochrome [Novosphingobium sp. EMRT-2]QCI92394.1 c-type cytochrome [Novosphingobium sp. EMRT-2]
MNKTILPFLPVVALAAAILVPAARGGAQTAPSAAANSAANGARLYQAKCGGCHSIAANKVGPAHKGVFGRKAGMAPGYNYSPAIRGANITWNATTLDQWLQGPQKMVKGTRMFLSVPNPTERAAIIAYLRSDAAK